MHTSVKNKPKKVIIIIVTWHRHDFSASVSRPSRLGTGWAGRRAIVIIRTVITPWNYGLGGERRGGSIVITSGRPDGVSAKLARPFGKNNVLDTWNRSVRAPESVITVLRVRSVIGRDPSDSDRRPSRCIYKYVFIRYRVTGGVRMLRLYV